MHLDNALVSCGKEMSNRQNRKESVCKHWFVL